MILHNLLKVVNINVLGAVIYAIGKQEHKSAFRKDIKHECTEDGSILLCYNKITNVQQNQICDVNSTAEFECNMSRK